MKTFRFLGMVLLAIVMCVNFASCSSDDDPVSTQEEELVKNEFGVIINEKKLLSITIDEGNGYVKTFDFRYNSKGCLTSINRNRNYVTNFTWGDNTVTQDFTYREGDNTVTKDGTTYVLLNNLIRFKEEFTHRYISNDISYNSSNQVTKLEIKQGYKIDGYTYNYEYNCTWDKDKLIKVTSPRYNDEIEITEYRYSGKTCKGYFFPFIYFYGDFGYLHYAHPELMGIRTNQLPDQIYENDGIDEDLYDFTYTFDKDGYVETCTVTRTGEWGYISTKTFTLKWV